MTLRILGHGFAYEMENLVRMFFPGETVTVVQGAEYAPDCIDTEIREGAAGARELLVRVSLPSFTDAQAAHLAAGATDHEAERALGRLLYDVLSAGTGIRLPWGLLTGVRPVRLCRTFADQFGGEAGAREILLNRYLVREDKVDLALGTARLQAPLLEQLDPRGFSLYISIPFCPTRCLYCSFVSHDIAGMRKLIPDYVRLLCRELHHTGSLAARLGLRLQSVYVGGGTPTSLEPQELDMVLAAVEESFDFTHLLEYTVEAGRPDTVTPEKLAVLRDRGVNRVSVNPQTMDDRLLRGIGRGHTAADVERAYAMARETGFSSINMDLIAGLPGETGAEFSRTIRRITELRPENVTVHTLTVKRSSRLRENDGFTAAGGDVSAQVELAGEVLTEAGYTPYYLYRQKGAVGSLENTGWALPGTQSLYNVWIMEEVQTILAAGAGAVSKLVLPGRSIDRVYNYKYPYEYIGRFDEMLRRKAETEDRIKERL